MKIWSSPKQLGLFACVSAGLAGLIAMPVTQAGPVQSSPTILETAASTGRFDTLALAVDLAGLTATLQGPGPFTVFAPTDSAFAKLPSERLAFLTDPANKSVLAALLLHHVAPGQLAATTVLQQGFVDTVGGQRIDVSVSTAGAFADSAKILRTDIFASNGVIHVIDEVLIPNLQDIVATAENAGIFGTLLTAVEAADLTAVLRGPGPFTVLAPSDDAFAKLPSGTVASLLLPQNKPALINLLTYHVVGSKAYSNEVLAAGSVQTLQGKSVTFTTNGTSVFANMAKVVIADLDASNGVVHVIDEVLMP